LSHCLSSILSKNFNIFFYNIKHPTTPTTDFAKAKAGRTAEIVHGFKSRLCSPQWSEGANENLRAIVDDAFNVGKSGLVSTSRVLGLRRLNIKDATWKKAMDAITESMQVVSSKTYMRFYERDAGSFTVALYTVSFCPLPVCASQTGNKHITVLSHCLSSILSKNFNILFYI